jgi:hypothetical protein
MRVDFRPSHKRWFMERPPAGRQHAGFRISKPSLILSPGAACPKTNVSVQMVRLFTDPQKH